eukprot:2011187-Pyramimonas_sp.AAC.1
MCAAVLVAPRCGGRAWDRRGAGAREKVRDVRRVETGLQVLDFHAVHVVGASAEARCARRCGR